MQFNRSAEVRLRHILEHIDAIRESTRNLTAEQISHDYLVIRALERSVEIVSEAAKAIPEDIRIHEPDVPWKDIVGIGNLLRHEYYRIDQTRMVEILNGHLPKLRQAIVRLLASLDKSGTAD